jgi:hypothetical protein
MCTSEIPEWFVNITLSFDEDVVLVNATAGRGGIKQMNVYGGRRDLVWKLP